MVIVAVADFVAIVISIMVIVDIMVFAVFYVFVKVVFTPNETKVRVQSAEGKRELHLIQTMYIKNNNQKNFDKTKIFTSNDSSLPTPMA